MSDRERSKKDGADPNKKRRRMRADVAGRHARAGAPRPQRDEGDTVPYKPGSGSDRNMRRGPAPE